MQTISADEARSRILGQTHMFDSTPDEEFYVEGEIDLSHQTQLTAIPPQIRKVWGLNLEGCTSLTSLPDGLEAHRMNLNDCVALKHLPSGLVVHSLQAQRSGLINLPVDLQVTYKLDLSDCRMLKSLPENLHTGSLIIQGCTQLQSLPDGLTVYFLNASNCTSMARWGSTGKIEVGNINLRGCTELTYLPEWMETITQLDIQGCTSLHQLPANMVVTSFIELAGSGLKNLPEGCSNTELRWRDVIINARIAFHPEMITAHEIMHESNIERRRVMLDRMGYDAFFRQANARELHRDFDPGGLRRLLSVDFEDQNQWQRDEPLVCLSIICPSTARHYIIRVPPTMQTCHQAAAWVAGFDDPAQYHPVIET